jgi:DNA-directed RNA polymerase specialized sigma24 family protein
MPPPSGLDFNRTVKVNIPLTVIAVARKMPGFRYDPQRGSFKQWLLRITHRRIADHLREVYRQPVRADIDPALPE